MPSIEKSETGEDATRLLTRISDRNDVSRGLPLPGLFSDSAKQSVGLDR